MREAKNSNTDCRTDMDSFLLLNLLLCIFVLFQLIYTHVNPNIYVQHSRITNKCWRMLLEISVKILPLFSIVLSTSAIRVYCIMFNLWKQLITCNWIFYFLTYCSWQFFPLCQILIIYEMSYIKKKDALKTVVNKNAIQSKAYHPHNT